MQRARRGTAISWWIQSAQARPWRLLILLAGLLVPQVVLLAPSLFGDRVFLPVDTLAMPGVYLPDKSLTVHDPLMTDPVLSLELWRQFSVAEVRSGRLPLWNPYGYAGYPHLAVNQTAVLSPYRLLDYAWPGPRALAWGQLLKSCVAGAGVYLFLRRAVQLPFSAALVGGWTWPLGGFLSMWAFFPHSAVGTWMGWIMLGVDATCRSPRAWCGAGLALAVAAAFVSGHAATAGQILIIAEAWAGFRTIQWHWPLPRHWKRAVFALAATQAAIILGLLVSMPQTLPTIEYANQSARLAVRAAGKLETPPGGFKTLGEIAFPFILGSSAGVHLYGGAPNLMENPAIAHVGAISLLFLAPLAWLDRTRRWICWFCAIVAAVCLLPTIDLPMISGLFALPPASMLPPHRWAIGAGFFLLTLASIGAAALNSRQRPPRPAIIAACVVMSLIVLVLIWRCADPPEWITAAYAAARQQLARGAGAYPFLTEADIARSMREFSRYAWWTAATAAIALALWGSLGCFGRVWPRIAPMIAIAAAAELTISFYGFTAQPDRRLYYPTIPALAAVAKLEPGRVCGVDCLPADLSQTHGLADIRGYDGLDPARYVQLMELFRDSQSAPPDTYARVQWFTPRWGSPLARMLGVRYWIARGAPRSGVTPTIRSQDYWVIEDRRALPRAFVPAEFRVINDDRERLALLAAADFDPMAIAYVESQAPIAPHQPASGNATVQREDPTHITIDAELPTGGMLVLADRWDPGWRATVQGRDVNILRVNHALRGVILPAGRSTVQFVYAPASFRYGLLLGAIGIAGCAAWGAAGLLQRVRPMRHRAAGA